MYQVAPTGKIQPRFHPPRTGNGDHARHPELSLRIDGVLAAAGLLALCFVWAAAMESGRTALILSSAGGLALSILLYRAIRVLEPNLIAPRLVALYWTLQLVWLLLIALLNLPTVLQSTSFGVDLSDHPLRAVLPLLVIPVASLVAVVTMRFFRGPGKRFEKISELADKTTPAIKLYLTLSASLLVVYWLAALPGTGVAGYVVRVLVGAMFLVPFLAGVFFHRAPGVRVVWIFAMGVNALIGLVVGSRLYALAPIALYIIGYITTLHGWKQRRAIAATVAAALVAVVVTGVIGVVRSELGRGQMDMFTRERIADIGEQVAAMAESGSIGSEVVLSGALHRLLIPTNMVVPILSPEVVPYRGWERLGEELAYAFQIGALSGISYDDLVEAGMISGPAVAYGFLVNEITSVEFGILPDGWSRGGFPVGFLFGFLLTLVYIGVETAARRTFRANSAAVLLLLMILARSAFFDTGAVTLLATLRNLVLHVGLVVVLIQLLNLLSGPKRKPVPRTF